MKTLFLTMILVLTLGACENSSPSPMTSSSPASPILDTSKPEKTPLPEWLQARIKKHQSQPVANPPISISKGLYQEKVVYYETSDCCDQFSSLYDQVGTLICAPDGGITGRGDGKCTDFDWNSLEQIWQDTRSH